MNKETSNQTASAPAVASGDLLGAYYHGSDGAATCALCNCEMEWEECGCCGGDGVEDAYELDSINYSPGDMIDCQYCNGQGGSWWCVTTECPTKEGFKVITFQRAPNE